MFDAGVEIHILGWCLSLKQLGEEGEVMVHSDYRRGGNLQRETDGCVVSSAASSAGLLSAAEADSFCTFMQM